MKRPIVKTINKNMNHIKEGPHRAFFCSKIKSNMAINKRLIKIDERPFHTSAYAQTINAGRVGAASTVSFERRQQIDNNRQKIGSYRYSDIGRSFGALCAKPVSSGPTGIGRTSSAPAEKPKPYNPYS